MSRKFGSSMMPNENPVNLVENDKWIEGCKKRLAILQPETEKAKRMFLENAAYTLKISQEELIVQSKRCFRQNFIDQDKETMQRQKASIIAYKKSEEYLKKAEEIANAIYSKKIFKIDPIDNDFVTITNILLTIKQEEATQEERAENALQNMSELDIMQTIRMMFKNENSIEELYKAWEKPWGDINILLSEANKRGIREELLEIIQNDKQDVPPFDSEIMKSCNIRRYGPNDYRVKKSLSDTVDKLRKNREAGVITVSMIRQLRKPDGGKYKEGTLQRTLYDR
jgi:hypothetical protein